MEKRKMLFLGFILLVFFSCKRGKIDPPLPVEPEIIEYPVMIIPDEIKTFVSDDTQLYPVNEDFLRNFLQRIAEYEGTHVKARSEFPQEWGVICMEQLPEGRELWLMQSCNREWKYLVITSGLGTQRIIDLLPVAVNIAVQDRDVLENENWITTREPDGSFLVEKNYEWIKSIEGVDNVSVDSNLSEYQKSSVMTDQYFINEMSRFEFVPKKEVAELKAVIFYYDKNAKPDEWDEYAPILQSYCEEKNILFDEIYSGYDNIRLRDYRMNEVAEIDITPYMGVTGAGMVMMKTGEEPKNVNFGSNERMKVEIKRYFNLLNQ